VTDLTEGPDGAVGRSVVAFRHVEGPGNETAPPSPIVVQSLDAMAIPGAPDRLVLLADLGTPPDSVADAAMLALYALSPKPRLLDVVEVGTDRDVGFAGPSAPEMLAPDSPLILVSSGHDNSNQSYRSTEMMFIRGDRFAFIGSVFTFGDSGCAYQRTQTPLFATVAAPGPYRGIEVRVREEVTIPADACEADAQTPRAGVSLHRATYLWDRGLGRFVTRSKELDRLAAEDAERF
jgi:hypothetical protein